MKKQELEEIGIARVHISQIEFLLEFRKLGAGSHHRYTVA